jgi:hypothetical protein
MPCCTAQCADADEGTAAAGKRLPEGQPNAWYYSSGVASVASGTAHWT